MVVFSYLVGRTPLLKVALGRFLKVVGAYYFGILEFAIMILPFANLAGWILKKRGYAPEFYVPILSILVLTILFSIYIRGMWNAWTPIVRTFEITVPKKAGDMKELRIAVASDLHLGNIVGNRHLQKMVGIMNNMNADLVLLPGDIIDEQIEPFERNQMAKIFEKLNTRHGTFAVLGNHEYYGGHIENYVQQMKTIGISVLQDEVVYVADSFYVIGRKDKTAESTRFGGRQPVLELVEFLDTSKPFIMMDHQPFLFEKALEAGVDILVCGHTHRGQFAPNHLVTKKIYEIDWGYLLKETLHVFVSSGYGTWGPPIRLASQAEIMEIVVKFE
jgi:predicted MPP superfamily phosphohydrolase